MRKVWTKDGNQPKQKVPVPGFLRRLAAGDRRAGLARRKRPCERDRVPFSCRLRPMSRPVLLFDLDGTLADTAADLCETLNVILEMHGRARVSNERVRHLVGGGARLLLERGYSETGEPASAEMLDLSFDEFLDYYGRHIADHTKLWPGVRDQLDMLAERGALMAVCTNKVEGLSRELLGVRGIDP